MSELTFLIIFKPGYIVCLPLNLGSVVYFFLLFFFFSIYKIVSTQIRTSISFLDC